MGRSGARVSLDVPRGWSRDDARLAPPDLSQSPQVALEAWRVDTHDGAVIVSACFAGDAGGWLPEADDVALQKLEAVIVSTYLRLGEEGGFATVTSTREGDVRVRAFDGPPAHARAWLAFEADGAVHGCFAECVRPDATCRAAVDGARLEGAFVQAPDPTTWMRAVAYAVHHPAWGAATILALAVFLGVLAVLTRRRPRHRP